MAQDNFKTTTPTSETWGENDKPVSDTGSTDWGAGDKEVRPDPPSRGFAGWGRDIAATAVKGAIAVPEALVGLADIPTGGRVGKLLENEGGAVGFRPKQAKELVNDWHSDATKEAQRKFQEADGIVDKAGVALSNPSLIATAVGESLPSMGLGGVAARGLMALGARGVAGAAGGVGPALPGTLARTVGEKAAPVIAGALGEGIVGAGSAAEQIRQQTDDGELTAQQAGLAGMTGAATAGFGFAGGKLANKLGIGDVDTMIAQGAASATAQASTKSIPRQVIEGALSEGLLEELPQSVSEQVLQNLATNKPWDDGVDGAIVMGTLAGMGMGGAAAGVSGFAGRGEQQRLAQLEQQRRAEIEQQLQNIPEHQQPAARAQLNAELNAQLQAEARAAGLLDEEQGPPDVPTGNPNDYRATPAWAKPPEDAAPDYGNADDEIFQSTGTTVDPVREAVRQAADAGGALSAAAGVAMDSGAAPTFMPPEVAEQPQEPQSEPVVLQNRDRTSAASIAQMQEIAAAPDYMRAGPSREMATGAPVVFGDLPGNAALGRQEVVVDGRGGRVQAQYAVVDAADVIASNNADGTTVSEYANGLPGKLRAVAGNGRTAGLQAAYQQGTANNYAQELLNDAGALGIDPQAVASIQRPVLVRVMGQSDVTADMGDRTNITSTQKLSPVEQAANDSRRFSVESLSFDEQGNPTAQSIGGFVSSMPVAERGDMLNPDGTPTRQAVDRLMAATFKQAYDSDELVQLHAQATDPDARSVLAAAADASGVMAALRGTGDFDVRGAVTDAVKMAVNAARQGLKLSDVLQNADFDMNPEAYPVATFLAQNIRSPKAMAEGLRRWGQLALQNARTAEENQYQGGLLGPAPTLSREEIFARIGDAYNPTEQAVAARAQPQAPVAEQSSMEPTPPAAMPVPGNFSGTPSATMGTRTDAVAGPGFGPRDLQSAIAQIRAQKQQAAQEQPTTPTQQGFTDGTQADQTQQGSAQPAQTQPADAPGAVARHPTWRQNAIQAGRVARALGLEPKGKRLAQIVAEVDAVDAQQTGAAQDGADLSSGPIDQEWSAFAPETGTLGIARAQMPQIKAEHRGALVNFLKARGIDSAAGEVPANDLKPTQAEFAPGKVKKAREFQGSERSILVSSDGHVVDGHHQWLAKRAAGEPVKVIRLKAPIRDVLAQVAEFPSTRMAEGAAPATPAQAATDSGADAQGAGAMFSRAGNAGTEAERQFKETERAYGGRAAYDRAKAAGKTRLTYGQWVQVRTPKFKAWFGDWEAQASNDLVNQQIDQWANGELSANVVLNIGRPSFVLTQHGVPNLPITLRQAILRKAVKDKHGVAAAELKDIAQAVQAPIAIFDDPDNTGTRIAVTEIRHTDGNIIAAIRLNMDRDGLEINDIRSLHPKRDSSVLRWVEDGLLLGLDKKKGRDWLENLAATNPQQPQASFAALDEILYDADSVRNASKAVDPDTGEPLAMYHGTSANELGDAFTYFDAYASNYGLMGQGAYFTDNPEVASSYTTKGKGDTPTVYKAFLSIQNPIDMDAKADPAKWQEQFDGIEDFHEGGDTNESWYRAAEDLLRDQGLPMWEGAEAMQDGLRAMGHDGITHIGGGRVKSDGVRHRVYIAFEPTQVKSATGNNGEFDGTNSDIRFSRMDDNAPTEGASNDQQQKASGIPAGLPATKTIHSGRLERIINDLIERNGRNPDFAALAVKKDALPDALHSALAEFERATGTRVVIFRNLTPKVVNFSGATRRDGVLYLNESADHPLTSVAAHEWLHNLRKTQPDLYSQLAQEVRRQGDAQGFAKKHGYEASQGEEELTAAAVGDAMTDPAFLEQLAQRNQGVFRRVARAFLDFLDTLTAGWQGQGSNAYLRDVQAFRDTLAGVLDRLPATGQDTANFAANPTHRPGSAQDKAVMQALADGKSARDVLRLIANGSKDPFRRQVARLLLKSGITPNIEFGHIGKTKDGTPIYGQYRGKTDTIAIAGSAEYAAERIFMHEAMHAATMRALAKPGLPSLQLRKLLAHVQKQKGAAGFYGTKNVDEFVAEVFTNPDFQNALRGMSAPAGNSLKSAWDSFVRILRGILGLPNDSLNALSQALELGVEAVRQDMVLRKQGAQAGRNANAGRDAIDQTETENFKRWFKDSKAVDADGKPLVVYHGTAADLTFFDPLALGVSTQAKSARGGFFFTSSQKVASGYAHMSETRPGIRNAVYANAAKSDVLTDDLKAMLLEASEKFSPDDSDDSQWINEAGGGVTGANVLPVYLSIQTPMVVDYMGNEYRERSFADVMAQARSQGHDGVVFRNAEDSGHKDYAEVSDIYVAFSPTQIKSAIGNNGNFDPEDPDIRNFGMDDTAAASTWESPVQSGFDDVIYKLQDKNIDLKRVVQAITKSVGKVADDINAYLKEELFHKRAAKRVADFGAHELAPLMNQMRLAGLSMEDVEEYLHARHAKEANAVLAERNPSQAMINTGRAKAAQEVTALAAKLDAATDKTQRSILQKALTNATKELNRWNIVAPYKGTEESRLMLSGMSDKAADSYFAKLDPAQRAKLEAVTKKVDAIIAGTRQLYVDYGLENQAVVDGWASLYKNYIPLMREDKDGGMGVGQGFSVKGKEVKGRTGSTRKVVDILANIASQREKLIVRGEKNRVTQALVGLAQANPNPDFWEVRSQAPTERVVDEATNTVVDHPIPNFKGRDNVVVAKTKDSKGNVTEQMVVFNEDNPRAVRMAAALKNLDAGNLEGLLAVSAKITRYFAAINTQYNPVFGVVNLIRDVQGAMINLAATPLAGQQAKIAKDTFSALRGIYSDIRKTRKGGQANSEWAKLWEQMQDDGGTTGYREMFQTSADRANNLKSILNPEGWMDNKWGNVFTANGQLKVPMSVAQKGATEIFGWLSDYNEAMENGVRLAAYKAALDKGMSREQAASIAKNLTVNFNRKGQVGQQAGAVYAFFNAAMQGTARIGQTLFEMDGGDISTLRLSKTGKAVVYGGVTLGAIQALLLAAAGFDDEDPPEFVRERSLIIPTGGKTYITIPMPLGLHVIPGIGRHATEFALSGFDKPAKRAVSVIGMFADAFNPIGNAGLSMQTLAPTALDPLAALTENKDWTGKPIARTSSNKALPGHTQWKDTATGFSKVVAEAINWVSGGNEYVAGALSPTPDQIDYLLAQLGGGVAREISKVQQTISTAASGEELPTYKIPLVGRFVGSASSQASQGNAFYANLDRLNELETEIKGLRKDGRFEEAAQLARENPQSILIAMANKAERDVQKLRREKRELIANDASREQVRTKEEQITAVMTRLNEAAARRVAAAKSLAPA